MEHSDDVTDVRKLAHVNLGDLLTKADLAFKGLGSNLVSRSNLKKH